MVGPQPGLHKGHTWSVRWIAVPPSANTLNRVNSSSSDPAPLAEVPRPATILRSHMWQLAGQELTIGLSKNFTARIVLRINSNNFHRMMLFGAEFTALTPNGWGPR